MICLPSQSRILGWSRSHEQREKSARVGWTLRVYPAGQGSGVNEKLSFLKLCAACECVSV